MKAFTSRPQTDLRLAGRRARISNWVRNLRTTVRIGTCPKSQMVFPEFLAFPPVSRVLANQGSTVLSTVTKETYGWDGRRPWLFLLASDPFQDPT
jgi:hypothetical protein